MSYYFHAVPGRLRIKSPLVKGMNNDALVEIKGLLNSISGIKSFDINTVTGSIVINYQPKVIAEKEIVTRLRSAGYFDPSRAVTNDHYIYNAISSIGHAVNKGVVGTFVGAAFEGTALSYLAVLL
jgi:copper chaperone CopZ